MDKIKSVIGIIHKYNVILTPSQKKWGGVLIIMTAMGAALETLGVSVILPLAQTMIEPEKLYGNILVNSMSKYLSGCSKESVMWIMAGAVSLVYCTKNLFLILLSYIRVKYSCKVQRELSCKMIDAYLRRGYLYFLDIEIGELVRGIKTGVNNVYSGLYHSFKLLAEFMTLVFICGYVMYTDFILSLTVMITVVISLLIVFLICQKYVKKYGEIYYTSASESNQNILHIFHSIKEILIGRKERYFLDKHKGIQFKMQKGLVGQTMCAEVPAYVIEATCVMGLIVAIIIKTVSTGNGELVVPELAAFVVAAFRILPSLGRISNDYNQILFCLPGINDVYENFLTVHEKEYLPNNSNQNNADRLNMKFQNHITIENIKWRYPNSDIDVLKDVSLKIKKGEAIAFVGKSGSGKTTLIDIILGLFNSEEGNVKVDGVSIKEIPDQWSAMIGFVSQDINLLNGSIRENIAFGIKKDEVIDEQIWESLEQSQLKEFVKSYPKGLDTEIGESGIRLSGGQRQRIAIARALYKNPDILILDEATSALDSETETAVMEAIEMLQGKKTLIIIAHRLTTIKSCDRIFEINDGNIVERKYEELE